MPDDGTSSAHGGPIIIGLRELYAQMQELNRSISELSAEMRMATQQAAQHQQSVAQQLADIRVDQGDHETRIRIIESRPVVTPRSVWAAIGVLTPIISLIVTIIIATALG